MVNMYYRQLTAYHFGYHQDQDSCCGDPVE